ncbi:lipid-binding SYLF domain-containing protein [Pelagibius sp. 7325]|uniref:lipid-binding SYLF domain-containing protein n=1 Tax=Pelagibius sp. 7325 TaxID=3131994 RepID=UPI0030EF2791
MTRSRILVSSAAIAAALSAGSAMAAGDQVEARGDAAETVRNATAVVEQMKADQRLSGLLEQSKGVFVVPDLLKGAFIVGAQGGDGVLLSHQNSEWSEPAFYSLGSVSIGAQGGGEQGAVAMILMSDAAIERFRSSDDFSFDAEAGVTLVDYHASAQADLADNDVVVWSDKEGAFVGASISASDISVDEEANRAYYSGDATPEVILRGGVESADNDRLQEALRQ